MATDTETRILQLLSENEQLQTKAEHYEASLARAIWGFEKMEEKNVVLRLCNHRWGAVDGAQVAENLTLGGILNLMGIAGNIKTDVRMMKTNAAGLAELRRCAKLIKRGGNAADDHPASCALRFCYNGGSWFFFLPPLHSYAHSSLDMYIGVFRLYVCFRSGFGTVTKDHRRKHSAHSDSSDRRSRPQTALAGTRRCQQSSCQCCQTDLCLAQSERKRPILGTAT